MIRLRNSCEASFPSAQLITWALWKRVLEMKKVMDHVKVSFPVNFSLLSYSKFRNICSEFRIDSAVYNYRFPPISATIT